MRLTRLSGARQRSLTGDDGCTGAFFDPCRYLRSQYQSRHGLVRAWADALRQRATLDDVLKAQHAGGFAHQPSMTALWLRTLCLRRWAGLSATGPQRADLRSDGHYQQRLDLACLIPTTDGLTARFAR